LLIQALQIHNFRNLQRVVIEPHSKLNFFFGDNGAGKTSVVEALVVLSRGRSFRTTQAGELIGPSDSILRIVADTRGASGQHHRLGLERSGQQWRARADGRELEQLSQLSRILPLVLMEPNSHFLLSGAPEIRRRYLDWGLFHVEQRFLEVWRRYSKALKQRNAALRSGQLAVLDSLDRLASELGTKLNRHREDHFGDIAGRVRSLLGEFGLPQDSFDLVYHQGWKGESLREALRERRQRDLDRGQTGAGPHRADLNISWNGQAARAVLSRGEQKSVAAALLLAQAQALAQGGEKPVVVLDDLASEFDAFHYRVVLGQAQKHADQVWVTGTVRPESDRACKVFHVERGQAQEVV
jgi:DNA replication and repair protein RecF